MELVFTCFSFRFGEFGEFGIDGDNSRQLALPDEAAVFGLNGRLAFKNCSLCVELPAGDGDPAIRPMRGGGGRLLLDYVELVGNVSLGDLKLPISDKLQILAIFLIVSLRQLVQVAIEAMRWELFTTVRT